MNISRKKALTALVEYVTNWPKTEAEWACTLEGWDWVTIRSSHGLLEEISLMSVGEDGNISENDWLSARGVLVDEVNETPPTLDLYTMGLHDEISISVNTIVTRVPGGWLYHCEQSTPTVTYNVTTTFVPYHKDFFQ